MASTDSLLLRLLTATMFFPPQVVTNVLPVVPADDEGAMMTKVGPLLEARGCC